MQVEISENDVSEAINQDVAPTLDHAYDGLGRQYTSGVVTLIDAFALPQTENSPRVTVVSPSGYGLDPITLNVDKDRQQKLEQLQSTLKAQHPSVFVAQLDQQRFEYAGLKDFSGWDETSGDKQNTCLETISSRLAEAAQKTSDVLESKQQWPLTDDPEQHTASMSVLCNIQQGFFLSLLRPLYQTKATGYLQPVVAWLISSADKSQPWSKALLLLLCSQIIQFEPVTKVLLEVAKWLVHLAQDAKDCKEAGDRLQLRGVIVSVLAQGLANAKGVFAGQNKEQYAESIYGSLYRNITASVENVMNQGFASGATQEWHGLAQEVVKGLNESLFKTLQKQADKLQDLAALQHWLDSHLAADMVKALDKILAKPWRNIHSMHDIIRSQGLITLAFATQLASALEQALPNGPASRISAMLTDDTLSLKEKQQRLDATRSALPGGISPHQRADLLSQLDLLGSHVRHEQPPIIQFLDLLTRCGEDNAGHGALRQLAAVPLAAWKGSTKLRVQVFSTERCPVAERQNPNRKYRRRAYCGICAVSFNTRFKFILDRMIAGWA